MPSVDNIADTKTQKSLVRKQFLTLRRAYSVEERTRDDICLCDTLLSSVFYRYCTRFLCFYPLDGEPNLCDFYQKAWQDGKMLYFPKTYIKGQMSFFRVSSFDELDDKNSKFHTREPLNEAHPFEEQDDVPVCLVPGVAFDASLRRIGYGKGYYDRFLSHFHGVKLGICHAFAMSENLLPYEKRYDKPLHAVYYGKDVLFDASKVSLV